MIPTSRRDMLRKTPNLFQEGAGKLFWQRHPASESRKSSPIRQTGFCVDGRGIPGILYIYKDTVGFWPALGTSVVSYHLT